MTDVSFLPQYFLNFLFILLRASVFIAMLPFFGSRSVPAQFKIGFVIAMALVLTPIVELKVAKPDIPFLVMREVMLGIALGFTARFVFFAVEIAAQLITGTMGLSIATAFDPEFGQSTEIGMLYGAIVMLVFLSINTHHDLIYVFVKSYEWVPEGKIDPRALIGDAVSIMGKMFVIALKLSAPVLIMMLITNLLLAFIYRAVPQINIFFISSPVYIFVGFLVMLFSISVFIYVSGAYFSTVKDEMFKVMSAARQ